MQISYVRYFCWSLSQPQMLQALVAVGTAVKLIIGTESGMLDTIDQIHAIVFGSLITCTDCDSAGPRPASASCRLRKGCPGAMSSTRATQAFGVALRRVVLCGWAARRVSLYPLAYQRRLANTMRGSPTITDRHPPARKRSASGCGGSSSSRIA